MLSMAIGRFLLRLPSDDVRFFDREDFVYDPIIDPLTPHIIRQPHFGRKIYNHMTLRNLTYMAAMESPTWSEKEEELDHALREWHAERRGILETDSSADKESDGGSDLWHHIPEIDSKEVAASRTIFKEVLGVDLDPEFVRPGGYDSIDEMNEHLVPQMINKAKSAEV